MVRSRLGGGDLLDRIIDSPDGHYREFVSVGGVWGSEGLFLFLMYAADCINISCDWPDNFIFSFCLLS